MSRDQFYTLLASVWTIGAVLYSRVSDPSGFQEWLQYGTMLGLAVYFAVSGLALNFKRRRAEREVPDGS